MKGDKEIVGTLRGFDDYVNMVMDARGFDLYIHTRPHHPTTLLTHDAKDVREYTFTPQGKKITHLESPCWHGLTFIYGHCDEPRDSFQAAPLLISPCQYCLLVFSTRRHAEAFS